MSEKYTLKEVSELFGITKSTLRFWERKGIIKSNRNIENDYREYTKEDLLQISDILNYRFSNYPIKDLKSIDSMSIDENILLIKEIQNQINSKKKELKEVETRIQKQMKNIHSLQEMQEGKFKLQEPNFDILYHLHVHYKDNVMKYTRDHTLMATVIHTSDTKIQHYGIQSSKDVSEHSGETLWIKDKEAVYCPFLLKVKDREINRSSIISAMKSYHVTEDQVNNIVAAFIINDDEYAYYRAWLELK